MPQPDLIAYIYMFFTHEGSLFLGRKWYSKAFSSESDAAKSSSSCPQLEFKPAPRVKTSEGQVIALSVYYVWHSLACIVRVARVQVKSSTGTAGGAEVAKISLLPWVALTEGILAARYILEGSGCTMAFSSRMWEHAVGVV